jgi:heptosyltransferase-2
MASPVNYEIMLNNRWLDEVILYDKRKLLKNGRIRVKSLLKLIKGIRGRFSLVVVPGTVSTSFTSDLLAFLTGAHVRVGVGGLDGQLNKSAFFFNVPVMLDWREDPHRHQTARNLDVAAPLGVRADDLSHELTLTGEEMEKGRAEATRLKSGKRYLFGFHPGAGKPPNRWPAGNFVDLIEELLARYSAVGFITSGPMDDEIIRTLLNNLKRPVELLENKPIREVASILREVDLYITNDTGLLHVAAGVGAPVIGLFGPTDPQQWAPIGKRIRYIQGEGGVIGAIPPNRVLELASELLEK